MTQELVVAAAQHYGSVEESAGVELLKEAVGSGRDVMHSRLRAGSYCDKWCRRNRDMEKDA